MIQTPPGEEGQVDKSVRLLTWQSSTRIWAELHEEHTREEAAAALDDARFVVGLLDAFPAHD